MAESLKEAQQEFTEDLAKLIVFINSKLGYKCRVGKEGLKHMKGSLHYEGVAHDVLLDKDSIYLTKTEDYEFAGVYWKSLRPENKWGGDFKNKDGNHFSHGWRGRA